MGTTRRTLMVGAFVGVAFLAAARRARAGDPLPPPVGKPVLTISGAIDVTNVGKTAVFDMASLEAVGLSHFVTGTPWDDGKMTYEGVRLDTLMQRVGARGDRLTAVALNDYAAELPISDFTRYGTLLATRRNNKYMPVSDKGPLFIIYPFDQDSALQQQTYYGRSVWQIEKFIVK